MTVELEVYDGETLTDLLGSFAWPMAPAWVWEQFDVGGGEVHLPSTDPSLTDPAMLRAENLVTIKVDGAPVAGWIIRRRRRIRGDTWDLITVAGPGTVELLRHAVVFMAGGLVGIPADDRLFAWQSIDYQLGAGWVTPTSLGTYADPTHPSLKGGEGDPGQNEIQRLIVDADTAPFPWGSSYPSPGGLGGTIRLTFRARTTSGISYNTSTGAFSAAAVKAALEALSNIDEVAVSGAATSGSPMLIEFTGSAVSNRQHPRMRLAHSDLRHDHATTTDPLDRVQSGSVAVEGEGLIPDWPDDRSHWFGEFGVLQHYRRELDLTTATGRPHAIGPAQMWVTSLGQFDVWFDGNHLGSGNPFDVLRFDVELLLAVHLWAIRSDAPMMAVIVRLDDEGNPSQVLFRTDPAATLGPWLAFGPGEPPGVTPGFILATLFDEAKARGYLPAITRDFDEDEDSLGRAWTQRLDLALQVGNDTVLDAAERLRDVGVFVDMSPAPSLVFSAYRGDRVNRGSSPDPGATTVTVPLDMAREVDTETEDEHITALLVRLEDRWISRHRAGQRREGFLSLGTVPSVRSATFIADRHLDDFTAPRQGGGWVTSRAQGSPQPAADYLVGDLILGPHLDVIANFAGAWGLGLVRVDTIHGQVTAAGDIDWTHEVSPA